jgi:hypothetical protein
VLHFHSVLSKRKYRILFSSKLWCRPGPKGPDKDLIDAVVAMKRRNPSWGCLRIAQQISEVSEFFIGRVANPDEKRATLFVAKGDKGVEAAGAARRNIAGDRAYD